MNTPVPPLKLTQEGTKLIYVVEDEPVVGMIVSKLLEKSNFRVKLFTNGEDFLESLQLERPEPDLVLLDLELPSLSGLEILKHIKSQESTAHIAAIMLTGLQDAEVIKEAYAVGGADYLLKPIVPERLLERVRANLTLKIEIADIQKILNFLHIEDPNLLHSNGLRDYINRDVRCYPIQYNSMQLCFLIPAAYRPKSFSSATPEAMIANILIFRKGAVRWNQVWPLRVIHNISTDFKKPLVTQVAQKKAVQKMQDPEEKKIALLYDPIDLLLSPFTSKEVTELQKYIFGKGVLLSSVWKSILKWSDDKDSCEKEIISWQKTTKSISEKFGVFK